MHCEHPRAQYCYLGAGMRHRIPPHFLASIPLCPRSSIFRLQYRAKGIFLDLRTRYASGPSLRHDASILAIIPTLFVSGPADGPSVILDTVEATCFPRLPSTQARYPQPSYRNRPVSIPCPHLASFGVVTVSGPSFRSPPLPLIVLRLRVKSDTRETAPEPTEYNATAWRR